MTDKALLDHIETVEAIKAFGYKQKPCPKCKGTGITEDRMYPCSTCEEKGYTWEAPLVP